MLSDEIGTASINKRITPATTGHALDGWNVWFTQTRTPSEELCRQVQALGGQVNTTPLLRVVPQLTREEICHHFDTWYMSRSGRSIARLGLLVTSVNTADLLGAAFSGRPDAHSMFSIPCFCSGRKSAAVMRLAGFANVFFAPEPGARALGAIVQSHGIEAAWYPRAAEVAFPLDQALRKDGVLVQSLVLYNTEPAHLSGGVNLPKKGELPPAVIVVASGKAVIALWESLCVGNEPETVMLGHRLVCTSGSAQAQAEKVRLKISAIASSMQEASILDAILSAVADDVADVEGARTG